MFGHAGPSLLAFLAGWLILHDSDLQIQIYVATTEFSYINDGELRCDSVTIAPLVHNASVCTWAHWFNSLLLRRLYMCKHQYVSTTKYLWTEHLVKSYFCTFSVYVQFSLLKKKVSMDPVHDRGSMDPVHESSPWTRSKVGVHGPLVHVLSSPPKNACVGGYQNTGRAKIVTSLRLGRMWLWTRFGSS